MPPLPPVFNAPPPSEAALLSRAAALAGYSLGELASALGWPVPPNLKRAKGWVGQLIERALGAPGGSAAAPDFDALGVELKTVPIDPRGRPQESTFICSATLETLAEDSWPTSPVYKKLARVLWVPVQGSRAIPLERRRVGAALLWSPSPAEEAILKADWDELAELVALGYVRSISARRGAALQLRPKGKDSAARTWAPDPEGGLSPAPVRAFYLRRHVVESILASRFLMTGG